LKRAWEETDPPLAADMRRERDNRTFAGTLAGVFFVLASIALWRERYTPAVVALALSVASVVAALFVPARLSAVRHAWMKIGEVLSFVTTPLLMAALYYLVVTPPALIRRLRRQGRSKKSAGWQPRPPLPPASRMERQF
jgi:VIT1/CCC1 family predicted Fe2+/Mn2+ transporter